MLLTIFLLQCINQLPVEQQGISTILLCLLLLEIFVGTLQVYVIHDLDKCGRGYY